MKSTGPASVPASVANPVALTPPAAPPDKPMLIVDNVSTGARH